MPVARRVGGRHATRDRRCVTTRRRKGEQQRTQTSTYTGAPVFDPT
jgi:hypothetical protein